MTKLLCLSLLHTFCYLNLAAALSVPQQKINRRSFVSDSLISISSITGGAVVALSSPPPAFAAADDDKKEVSDDNKKEVSDDNKKEVSDDDNNKEVSGVTVYKTRSGLQYIELEKGSGPSPMYGQFVSISFTAYMQLPNKKEKEKFDSDVLLFKHGSGRMIAGLDEGLHTMKMGGIRRIIIPPKLGYVTTGLGPLPQSPIARFKLNQLLEKMVAVRGGNLIYDVQLKLVRDDEADQGYYTDETLTEEQVAILQNNIKGPSANQ